MNKFGLKMRLNLNILTDHNKARRKMCSWLIYKHLKHLQESQSYQPSCQISLLSLNLSRSNKLIWSQFSRTSLPVVRAKGIKRSIIKSNYYYYNQCHFQYWKWICNNIRFLVWHTQGGTYLRLSQTKIKSLKFTLFNKKE